MSERPEPARLSLPPVTLGALWPLIRRLPKHPLALAGVLVGVGGVLAWRNRKTIARKAGPMIEGAKTRGQAAIADAATTLDDVKARGRAAGKALKTPHASDADASAPPPYGPGTSTVTKARRARTRRAAKAPAAGVH